MMTDSTNIDSKETTCAWIFKKIWPIIFWIICLIVDVVAYIQLVLSIAFAVFVIIVAIFLYNRVYKKADALAHNSVFVFMDNLLGTEQVSKINEAIGVLIMVVVSLLILASCCLYASVQFYRGLQKEKVEYVIGYFIVGTTFLGFRVWNITSYEYRNFPEDLTVLYCGLYALYLVIVLIVSVQMCRLKKMRAELANLRETLLIRAAVASII